MKKVFLTSLLIMVFASPSWADHVKKVYHREYHPLTYYKPYHYHGSQLCRVDHHHGHHYEDKVYCSHCSQWYHKKHAYKHLHNRYKHHARYYERDHHKKYYGRASIFHHFGNGLFHISLGY